MNELIIIFLVGIVPCLIVGVWQTYVGCRVLNKARRSQNWQITRGTLVNNTENFTSNEVTFHLNTSLQIAYQVDGQKYLCEKVNLYENWKQRAKTKEQVQELTSFLVYYNPNNHQEAIIEKGIKSVYWLPIILGISSLTMATLSFFFLVLDKI